MKKLLIPVLLISSAISAQSFRIFDNQMNDVTGGVMFVADTNSNQMQIDLTVENIDTVARSVTAGRLMISQPAGSTDAFIWGPTQYLPNTDSSGIAQTIQPTATDSFLGYYFPNNNGGTATINYCFWERTDMNNNVCVTVTFDNYFPAGITAPIAPPVILYGLSEPREIGVGWGGISYTTVNLYSSDGKLIESRDVRGQGSCGFLLQNLAPGIYMISCVTEGGEAWNSRFLR